MASTDAKCSSRAGSTSRLLPILLLAISPAAIRANDYVGALACRACHLEQYTAQSKTGHATALARNGDIWNFGSGLQAVTPVSRISDELYKEHGLTKYSRTKREGITPGHQNAEGVPYRVYDPGAQILKCFQCHSTGPLSMKAGQGIQPAETGVRCETCHGPGGDHARSPAKANIFQPRRLNGAGLNELCGNCHRQPPKTGDDVNWSDPWNARHQPVSFAQSACFLKSEGRLTCLTCHDAHGARPARQDACQQCHQQPRHAPQTRIVKNQACASCHMPLVKPSPDLQFANHWIGVYRPGNPLLPELLRLAK